MIDRKISLAKANKIRNILQDKILPSLEDELSRYINIPIVGFETLSEISNRTKNARTMFMNIIEKRRLVKGAIFDLRNIIHNANVANHVDEKMTLLEHYKSTLKFLKKFEAISKTEFLSDEEIMSATNFINQKPVETRYNSGSTTRAYPVKNDFLVNLADQISTVENNIRYLEEERNTINYGVPVSLDESLVKVLETYKLL